ncbi:MAG: hypothetical protein WC943_03570, partial [Elusimicrobiota bacterium]
MRLLVSLGLVLLPGLCLAAVPPVNPQISAIFVSSITLSYGAVACDGYTAEASTASDFTGTVRSSITA